MYVERKVGNLGGDAVIGRVTFSNRKKDHLDTLPTLMNGRDSYPSTQLFQTILFAQRVKHNPQTSTHHMSNDPTNSYHGTDHDKIDSASDIQPIPESFQVPNAPAIDAAADCEPRYSEVFFHGNYGMLCGQYQEFTRYNITESQIRQIGWAAFGNCGWNADRCS